jgi:replicative DNA helicase
MGICHDFALRAGDPSEDAIDVLGDLEFCLSEVADSTIQSGLKTITEVIAAAGGIDKIFDAPGEISGLRTHYNGFDRMTGGLQDSELIIIAARPAMGKTAWAINIAENAAILDGKVVAIFSLEMSDKSLLKRMVASRAGVPTRRAQAGFIGAEEKGRILSSVAQIVDTKLFIDETPGMTLAEMRAKARRLKQQQGLDLIVVDYLQLIGSKKKSENRTQEVSAISRGLKALAKELKVPVVALSQLSRESERGTDKRPLLSHLRESGSIEQDADVVAFIHREEYYDRDNAEVKGMAEIIVAKQRNGPTGTINLAYLGDLTRFENLAVEER